MEPSRLDREPSPALRQAYRLADQDVPAVWIAVQCNIPVALAELIITEVRDRNEDPPDSPDLGI